MISRINRKVYNAIAYIRYTMKVREERLFKVPMDEIRELLKREYGIDLAGVDPYLENDHVVFAVIVDESGMRPATKRVQSQTERRPARARRRKRRRNRIRTRGWNVVAKIQNSKGLVANIYEPLVKALDRREIAKSEQRKVVRQLLIANGNDPSEESVEYFLTNTLEFLSQRDPGALVANA